MLEHEEVDCDPEGNKFHTTCDHDEQALHFVAAILAAWANLGETVQEVVKSAALSGAAQEKGETG